MITAKEKPVGVIITHAKSFNFVFERKPESGWSEAGAKVDGAVIGRSGLFDLGDTVGRIAASGTASGMVHATRKIPSWTSSAEMIARVRGTVFGYEFTVQGHPSGSPVDVRVAVEHPPFQAPGSAQPSALESWIQPVVLEIPSVAGYTFDEDWEMIPGTWTVRVYHGSRLLCEKAYSVE